MRFFLIFLFLAQTQSEISQSVFEARQAGRLLKAWNLLLEGVRKFPSMRDQVSQFAPNLGLYREAIRYEDLEKPEPANTPVDLSGLKARDALDVIAEQAQSHRVVILNEAHYSSQSRAFAQLLAERLKFPYLAAETFGPQIFAIHEYGYPARDAGYYLLDPFFGDFVRQAVRQGYRPINYEQEEHCPGLSVDESIARREEAQANHLLERFFLRHPQEKLLIYVGHGHVAERGKQHWMAARLAEKAGLDPLTIDQTTLVEHSNPNFENPVYRALDPEHPVILEDAQGNHPVFGSYEGRVDLQVAHPRSREIHGRPQWMRLNGYRREVPVQPQWLPRQGNALLQAYRVEETIKPIAVDRLLVSAESEPGVLLLPSGQYRITRQDAEGNEETLVEKLNAQFPLFE